MSEGEKPPDDAKSHAPTPQKLHKAREMGDVPYSTEVTAAATYGALLAAITFGGGWSAIRLGEALSPFFRHPQDLAQALMSTTDGDYLTGLIAQIFAALAPIFAALALAAAASILAQRAVAFAPSKIKPKIARLSVIDNAKQKFGPSGLFDFAKNLIKLFTLLAIMGFAYRGRFADLTGLAAQPATALMPTLLREAVFFLGLTTVTAMAVAAVDLPWRRAEHEKRQRMTFEELKREGKETEGDPGMKGALREKGRALAMNRMMADVPKANVVLVNPTHYAVALSWDRDGGAAPVCVAKGVDEIAARIRKAAAEAGVPIRRDPPTARAIFATVDIGEEVRREHYAAVAAAIHYADEAIKQSQS